MGTLSKKSNYIIERPCALVNKKGALTQTWQGKAALHQQASASFGKRCFNRMKSQNTDKKDGADE
jgi:hypothetical protein